MRKVLAAAVLLFAACGDGGSATTTSAVLPEPPASGWAAAIDNPWLPFAVGSEWVYEAVEGDTVERIEVRVTSDTRTVNGLPAVVVHDVVSIDGAVIEDTLDWYLQDAAGNVWYVGEDSREMEDGEVVSTEGSWEWGVDGALPGIIMHADPAGEVGTAYYQEFYPGEAEDKAEIVRTGDTVTVAAGTFTTSW